MPTEIVQDCTCNTFLHKPTLDFIIFENLQELFLQMLSIDENNLRIEFVYNTGFGNVLICYFAP